MARPTTHPRADTRAMGLDREPRLPRAQSGFTRSESCPRAGEMAVTRCSTRRDGPTVNRRAPQRSTPRVKQGAPPTARSRAGLAGGRPSTAILAAPAWVSPPGEPNDGSGEDPRAGPRVSRRRPAAPLWRSRPPRSFGARLKPRRTATVRHPGRHDRSDRRDRPGPPRFEQRPIAMRVALPSKRSFRRPSTPTTGGQGIAISPTSPAHRSPGFRSLTSVGRHDLHPWFHPAKTHRCDLGLQFGSLETF